MEVTVQFLCSGNSMIERHRNIQTILKDNDELRMQYEEFKKTLAGLEKQEYRAKKKEWLIEYIEPFLKNFKH